MYKLVFFVPDSHLESVKTALFGVGAGVVGDYEHCCWQVLGRGQFRPKAGAQPFIGALGELEELPEWRVELVCADTHIRRAVAALVEAHPYEEPAYDVWRLGDLATLP